MEQAYFISGPNVGVYHRSPRAQCWCEGCKGDRYQNTAGETVEYEGEGWTSTSIEGGKVEVK
jgi:hypothetical protein